MHQLVPIIKKPVALAAIVVFLFLAWLAFRPELLFVNKTINEPFPTAAPRTH